ncbi:hypothetical protein JW968_05255 [Candidatus Woesearchaeota archaeon]|nr:hypothetical protein [Candidatus Woesearchaeota archaeon]
MKTNEFLDSHIDHSEHPPRPQPYHHEAHHHEPTHHRTHPQHIEKVEAHDKPEEVKDYPAYQIDESQEREIYHVNIANPISLGINIAIGMFIVFPLFVIAIFVILLLFGVSVGSIF